MWYTLSMKKLLLFLCVVLFYSCKESPIATGVVYDPQSQAERAAASEAEKAAQEIPQKKDHVKIVIEEKDDYEIEWVDPFIEKRIRTLAGIPYGAVRYSDVLAFTELFLNDAAVSGGDITTLEDLSHFKNLQELYVWGYNIWNLEPLKDLPLTDLHIENASVDWTVVEKGEGCSFDQISEITSLERVSFRNMNTYDGGLALEPLKNLVYLEELDVIGTDYESSQLGVLAELPFFTTLYTENSMPLRMDSKADSPDFSRITVRTNNPLMKDKARVGYTPFNIYNRKRIIILDKSQIFPLPAEDDYIIEWKSKDIEAIVRAQFSANSERIPYGEPIKKSDVLRITEFVAETDEVLDDLAHFTNLRVLSLSGLRDTDINPIVHLPMLTELSITNSKIVNAQMLAAIPSLTYLDVSDSANSLSIEDLSSMVYLETLILDNTSITAESYFANFSYLKTLSIRNCGLKSLDTSFLAQMNQLENLFMDNTRVSSADGFASATALKRLSWNKGNAELDFIKSATKLEYLSLNENSLKGTENTLRTFKNLKILFAENTEMSDLSFMRSLPRLESIRLDFNPIPKEAFKSALTNYNKKIVWKDAFLEGKVRSYLQIFDRQLSQNDINNITELDLRVDKVNELSLRSLDDLLIFVNLKKLWVDGYLISDYSALANLPLTHLYIDNGHRTVEIEPGMITTMSSWLPSTLTHLALNHTRIDELTSVTLPKLEYLEIQGDILSSIEGIENYPNLKTVALLSRYNAGESRRLDLTPLTKVVQLRTIYLETDYNNLTPLSSMQNIKILPSLDWVVGQSTFDVRMLSESIDLGSNDMHIEFTDEHIERTVREKLNMLVPSFSYNDPILKSHLLRFLVLDLSSKKISSPQDLVHFENLYALDISSTGISDISFLTELTNLRRLSIRDLKLRSISSTLEQLTNLRVVMCNEPTDGKSSYLNSTDLAFITENYASNLLAVLENYKNASSNGILFDHTTPYALVKEYVESNDTTMALYYAVQFGWTQLVQTIIEEGDFAIHYRDKDGKTLLMCAAETNENTDIARLLLEAGANSNAKDNDGRTAEDYANITGRISLKNVEISK